MLSVGDMTDSSEQDAVERLLRERPSFHLGGSADWKSPPDTLTAISASVKPGDVTLEIGVGASTVVFAAAGATHTAISPDPREHELVLDYCRRIGVDERQITFIAGFSEDLLPSLLGRERTLDVAFIDGAHSFPYPEIDWFYVSRSLKPGATLILDDITIPSVAPVFRHVSLESNWRLDRIVDDRGAVLTFLRPPLDGDDWIAQGMNSGYPDFSFAAPLERLKLVANYQAAKARQAVARRSPRAAHVYRQLSATVSNRRSAR